jgi:phage/plasmid-like protein (TIGR03299 family)
MDAAKRLDWSVGLEPLFLADGRKVDDRRAVVRQTQPSVILGTVGAQYAPIQNADAFAVLSEACTSHGVTIESAGALGDGARTWMLAKLPEAFDVTPGDTVRGYFLIVNGHDGSTAYGARPTPIRVVCQNTLNVALGSGVDLVRIRHTRSAGQRVDEAARLVTSLIAAMHHTGDTFAALAAQRMTAAQVAAYVSAVLPSPAGEPVSPVLAERRRNVAALVWCGKGAEMAGADANGATAWAAYNAVCEYFDHVRPAEAKSRAGRANANESAIFGGNQAIKVSALRQARQLVAA